MSDIECPGEPCRVKDAKSGCLCARVAELEAQNKELLYFQSQAEIKAEARVAELEKALANEGEMRESVVSRLVGANRCIAELERLRCDCGAKS